MRWTALAVVPALLFLFTQWELAARGSYYERGHYDPEYQYVLNGLKILLGGAPDHIDHPGTTLQLLVAFGLDLRYLLLGPESPGASLRLDVLGNPEAYVRTLQGALALSAVLLLFLAAAWLAHRGGLFWAAVAFQLLFLLSPSLARALVRLWPEALLIIVVLLIAPLLVALSQDRSRRVRLWEPLLLGLLLGAGLVTKNTFLPLLLLLLWPAGWRGRGLAAVGLLMGVLVFTMPMWPQANRAAQWIGGLVLKQDVYGSGSAGFLPAPQVLLDHVVTLVSREPVYLLALVLLVAAGLSFASSNEPTNRMRLFRLNLALLILFTGLLMAAKFDSPRYLVPELALLGPLLLVETLYWRAPLAGARWVARIPRWLAPCIAIALLAAGSYSFFISIQREARLHLGTFALDAAVAQGHPDCTVIPYYGASDLRYGLQLASDYTAGSFSADLASLYPHALSYHVWSGRFQRFEGFIPADSIRRSLAAGQCILLRGLFPIDAQQGGIYNSRLELQSLPVQGPEVLYRLRALRP